MYGSVVSTGPASPGGGDVPCGPAPRRLLPNWGKVLTSETFGARVHKATIF